MFCFSISKTWNAILVRIATKNKFKTTHPNKPRSRGPIGQSYLQIGPGFSLECYRHTLHRDRHRPRNITTKGTSAKWNDRHLVICNNLERFKKTYKYSNTRRNTNHILSYLKVKVLPHPTFPNNRLATCSRPMNPGKEICRLYMFFKYAFVC